MATVDLGYTPQQMAEANEDLYEKIASDDRTQEKSAQEDIDKYTRIRFREECYQDIIMPPKPIQNEELDQHLDSEEPVKFEEIAPWSPGAASLNYNNMPKVFHIRGRKYEIGFQRISSRKFMKDVDLLRTYKADLRQIFSDDAVTDIMDYMDERFIAHCDDAMYAPDTPSPVTGYKQYQTISSAITRESLWDSTKIMPKMINRLEPSLALANNITMREFLKLGRDELGGDTAQDFMMNGFTAKRFVNMKWLFTIKQNIVVDGRVIFFAPPEYLGKHYELTPLTMHVKREAFIIQYFHYLNRGIGFGNLAGVCSVKFAY